MYLGRIDSWAVRTNAAWFGKHKTGKLLSGSLQKVQTPDLHHHLNKSHRKRKVFSMVRRM
jgi:hypothetical protein